MTQSQDYCVLLLILTTEGNALCLLEVRENKDVWVFLLLFFLIQVPGSLEFSPQTFWESVWWRIRCLVSETDPAVLFSVLLIFSCPFVLISRRWLSFCSPLLQWNFFKLRFSLPNILSCSQNVPCFNISDLAGYMQHILSSFLKI